MEALKNCDHRVVGTKQVLRGLKSGALSQVYVANDADTFLYQRIVRAAEAAQVPVVRVPTMKELGAAQEEPPEPDGSEERNMEHHG